MSLWEYKILTSGALGFGSLPLLESHLNQLGKEQWEIISWQTAPGNPLIFQGLARRPILRDWFPETSELTRPPRGRELPGSKDKPVPEARPTLAGDEEDDEDDALDDVPTLFEALRPHLRRNKHGGGWSVGVEFLAHKFEQDEAELKAAFAECGMRVPARPEDKPDFVESDGWLYWLNLNQRGQLWVNAQEKRAGKPKAQPPARKPEEKPRPVAEAPAQEPITALPAQGDTDLLDRLRGLMRRNRRGEGYSGNLAYLANALRQEGPQLLAALTALGLREPSVPGDKPAFIEAGGILYWLNKNQGGQVWLNGRPKTRSEAEVAETPASAGMTVKVPAAAPKREDEVVSAGMAAAARPPPGDNVLAALRLLLTKKKTGAGFTGEIGGLAKTLGKNTGELMAALDSAGLQLPETPKGKPTFAEHGDEIFWLNRNARGQVWLNAKEKPKKPARGKKLSE